MDRDLLWGMINKHWEIIRQSQNTLTTRYSDDDVSMCLSHQTVVVIQGKDICQAIYQSSDASHKVGVFAPI